MALTKYIRSKKDIKSSESKSNEIVAMEDITVSGWDSKKTNITKRYIREEVMECHSSQHPEGRLHIFPD